jgi:transcriptional/translational regulatory protein YebC/TACO1
VANWGFGAAVGGDVNNVRLIAAVNKAKAANMPKDKIEAAIKRGVEGKDGSNAEAVLYEASGPAGSAMMVSCVSVRLLLTNADHGALSTRSRR